MKNITAKNLYLLSKNDNVQIIDIRTKYEYKKGHIQNSINVVYEVLITNVSKYLNMQTTYYLICSSGKISSKACSYLQQLGYKVISVSGGYDKWVYPLAN